MCLQRDKSLEEVCEVPLDPLRMAVLSGPAMVTMSTSCIVKYEVTGVTYMDTLTTLMGQVTLSGPRQEALAQGSTIQGCGRPHLVSKQITAFGQRGKLTTAFQWGSELMTAFGQRGQPMTASWQKKLGCHWAVNIPNTNFIYMPWQLLIFIDRSIS